MKIKIKPKFEFDTNDIGIGVIINRSNDSKKYIRDNKTITYFFGIALFLITFAINIEIEWHKKEKNKCTKS